jgi:protoheme ferro-lyase
MKGVLLVNLGSPESPTAKDVKPYLDEFLMDKYVIDVPFLLRALLVRGIILQTRPKKSAEAYARIWTDEGSPLIVISKKMHEKVKGLVDIPVALAMRYGNYYIKRITRITRQRRNRSDAFPFVSATRYGFNHYYFGISRRTSRQAFSKYEIYYGSCVL